MLFGSFGGSADGFPPGSLKGLEVLDVLGQPSLSIPGHSAWDPACSWKRTSPGGQGGSPGQRGGMSTRLAMAAATASSVT